MFKRDLFLTPRRNARGRTARVRHVRLPGDGGRRLSPDRFAQVDDVLFDGPDAASGEGAVQTDVVDDEKELGHDAVRHLAVDPQGRVFLLYDATERFRDVSRMHCGGLARPVGRLDEYLIDGRVQDEGAPAHWTRAPRPAGERHDIKSSAA